jgi:hypothetical protein
MTTTSQEDILLTSIYKNMLNVNNIVNVSGDTLLLSNTTFGSDLNTSGFLTIQADTTVLGNLYVSGISIINDNMTGLSLVSVNGPVLSTSQISSLGNLYVSANAYFQQLLNISSTSIVGSNVTFNTMYISGATKFTSGTIVNNIYAPVITFNSPIINIGNNQSAVYLKGSNQYISTINEYVIDKQVYINYDYTLNTGIDDGSNSGIEIIGISGIGTISTNENATKYKIITPLPNAPTNYIATVDLSNNLIVTGYSILRNAVTTMSSLNISGNTIFNNNTSFNSSVNVSGPYVSLGSLSAFSSLVVNNNSTFISTISTNSSLNVSNTANIQSDTFVKNNLFMTLPTASMLSNLNTTLNSSLNVSGNSLLNNITVNGNVNISGNSIVQGPLICNTNLYVSGVSTLNGNVSITGNSSILGNSTIYGNTTVQGNILSSGPTILKGNINVGYDTGLSLFNILGPLTTSMAEYSDNTTAKNAGVPVYGFYRTGGIIKVRLYDQLPTLTLIGNSTISIITGNMYIEPGISAVGNYNNAILAPYINNITNSNSNIVINGPIYITNNYLLTTVSSLISDTYTINYNAIDEFGNKGTITRILILS